MKLLVDAARTAGIVHVAEADDHELTDDEISDTPDYPDDVSTALPAWDERCAEDPRDRARSIPF